MGIQQPRLSVAAVTKGSQIRARPPAGTRMVGQRIGPAGAQAPPRKFSKEDVVVLVSLLPKPLNGTIPLNVSAPTPAIGRGALAALFRWPASIRPGRTPAAPADHSADRGSDH
jgi:hypothetical protein